jgi:hypothetical protein
MASKNILHVPSQTNQKLNLQSITSLTQAFFFLIRLSLNVWDILVAEQLSPEGRADIAIQSRS